MGIIGALASLALIVLILFDGFETMVLPRRASRGFRPTRLFYRCTWTVWRGLGRRLRPGKRRDYFLSLFGPLSLLALLATWVSGLIVAFALLHRSLGTELQPHGAADDFTSYLYLSGVTFFTLGFGDVTAREPLGRFLTVFEAGMGFGFLAVIIGYLPVLYQAFSRREVTISMLDARAGSPPSAAQLLLRLAHGGNVAALLPFLAEWERWAAEVLESHLSFPVLSYYRSQHDNQSWLGTLCAVLDTCALLLTEIKGVNTYQTQLTFAMARHAVVDLAMVFLTPPRPSDPDRLAADQLAQLRQQLSAAGLALRTAPACDARLTELRGMYEPFLNALADYFLLYLPPILPEKTTVDNWQTSAWMRRAPGITGLPAPDPDDDHVD